MISAQIDLLAIATRRKRPIELRSGDIEVAELGFVSLGSGSGQIEFRPAPGDKWVAKRDVLRPCDRSVEGAGILDALCKVNRILVELNPSLERELSFRQSCAHDERVTFNLRIVLCDGCFAVHGDTGCRFFLGWSTEEVQAQIVPHDAREQLRFRPLAILRVQLRTVGRGLD